MAKFPYPLLVVFFLLITGCTLQSTPPLPSQTNIPSNSLITPNTPDSDWRELLPGLEQRTLDSQDGAPAEITALRIDPTLFTFRAHYQAGNPYSLTEWRTVTESAVGFVNANFFDPQYRAQGLLIVDGQFISQSFQNRGGWFGLLDDQPFIRSTTQQPYAGEAVTQAVQAFPMLVLDGAQAYTSTAPDRITRRTAIGQDAQGRIILLATPGFGTTLRELSAYLAESDLNLVNAFNLDGGGSTMMSVTAGNAVYTLGAFDRVPTILAVYPR